MLSWFKAIIRDIWFGSIYPETAIWMKLLLTVLIYVYLFLILSLNASTYVNKSIIVTKFSYILFYWFIIDESFNLNSFISACKSLIIPLSLSIYSIYFSLILLAYKFALASALSFSVVLFKIRLLRIIICCSYCSIY